MTDTKVKDKVKALIEKARLTGKPVKMKISARHRSSLPYIIKTKEQADAFMAALKAL